jgi:hypothetical protein
LNDDTDEDAAIAYYLFVNHGILPHVVLEMGTREKAFVMSMAKRELKSRPKVK